MTVIYSIYLYFRATLFSIIFMPLMILCSLIFPRSIYKVGRFISKGIFRCFNISYDIIGKIPNKGPYILMHNHSSFLDLFFLPTVIKGKYTGLVAAKNFKIPLIGSILHRIKAIPIHRFNHTKALDALKIAEQRIKEGYHLAIFPEGTRTITGKLNPFKKGGFHMAINTNTQILPVIVKGLYNIKPRNRWTINKGIAKMIIAQPISVANKTAEDLLQETYNIIQEKV